MNFLIRSLVYAVLMGLGATFMFDLWGLFLDQVTKITSGNICLIGRWLLYMLEGTFRHSALGSVPPKRAECLVGWIAHYLFGIAFAVTFVAISGRGWLQQPTLIPAIFFGLVTVLAPFFIMQPAFGLGWAAAKTPNPGQVRLRSLMNHTTFGVGLYLFAVLANGLLGA